MQQTEKKRDIDYLKYAFDEAYFGMRRNDGGPFGAIIVLDNEIIGRGHNQVTSLHDPTAHAEIVAIRNACSYKKTFHLTGATLYASCEPCPMCMSAIYWADIKTVFYCSDRHDAAKIGFNDEFIYNELSKPMDERTIKMKQIDLQHSDELFEEWSSKYDKTTY